MCRKIIPIRADQTWCQRSKANGDTMDGNSSFASEDQRNIVNLSEGEPANQATETGEHFQGIMSPAQDDASMEEFGEERPAESPNSASDVEPSKTQFDAPPRLEGEITLSLRDLIDWKYHCAAMSKQSEADAALLAAALDPEFLPPIEVIEGDDRNYAVKDGHRRVQALRTVHHNKMDTQVRCIVYPGSERYDHRGTGSCGKGIHQTEQRTPSRCRVDLSPSAFRPKYAPVPEYDSHSVRVRCRDGQYYGEFWAGPQQAHLPNHYGADG